MLLAASRLRPLALVSTLAVVCATSALAQTREKKEVAADFPTLLKQALAEFEGKKFSSAIDKLQAAVQVAMEELEKSVIAAMPKPEGFKVKKRARRGANPYGAALLGSVGVPIEHSLTGDGGRSVKVTCMMKSPMVKMMSMAFAVAGNDPNKEKIGYGTHAGLLEKKRGGKQLQLQIVISDKHLITVDARGVTDKELFAMFDQAFVDKLAALLGS